MKKFEELSNRSQIEFLRTVASDFLAQYNIQNANLKLINHGYNTTFRVLLPDNTKYALRLNVNSTRNTAQMQAEVEWIQALGNSLKEPTDPIFPTPIPTTNGSLIGKVQTNRLGEVRGVLYSWLNGGTVSVKPVIAVQMGNALRRMHQHAETFQFSPKAQLHAIKDSYFGREYILDKTMPHLNHNMLRDILERADQTINRVMQQEKPIPIHYDLHAGNIKWHKNKLAVFDFDDCVFGRPIIDIGIADFYIRRSVDNGSEYLWEGLQSTPESFGLTRNEYENLVASRNVALANEFFVINNAGIRNLAPEYAEVTQKRIENFLENGVFDPKSASLREP